MYCRGTICMFITTNLSKPIPHILFVIQTCLYDDLCEHIHVRLILHSDIIHVCMGWLRLVGSIKL